MCFLDLARSWSSHLNGNIHSSYHQILIFNQRIQKQNRVADGFPSFIREGFDVKVIAPGYTLTPEGSVTPLMHSCEQYILSERINGRSSRAN